MADNGSRPRPPPNRRRDKLQLSCDPCRHRKARCDRQQPCGGCTKRGLGSSCIFATPASFAPSPQARQSAAAKTTSLNDRISELESLVVTLMKGRPIPGLPTPHTPESSEPSPLSYEELMPQIRRSNQTPEETVASPDPGTLKVRECGTSYVQSDHWEAILSKIRGLMKDDLVADSKGPQGSYLFYGPNRHASLSDILAAIPPRPLADRLMAVYFDSHIVTPLLIHSKKFLREYESFWQDPASISVAWIGLLFSMLYIATQLQLLTLDVDDLRADSLRTECLSRKDAFREKAVQCLVLARYTAGGPYVLETLITILIGESLVVKETGTDGWLSISMILHLAMRMGYHRDPDHFPGLSPLEGEMRRRMWTTIIQMDLVLSLEMGLPRNATDSRVDTKHPRNLLDSDFDKDTTEMPPSRPETECTPVLPLICKARLNTALGLICDINTDIHPPSYDEVVRVDGILQDVQNRGIPPVLRWQPHSITDSPNIVLQRIGVQTSYHKARILLHRKALICAPVDPSQGKNTAFLEICLNAALKILSFQEMLHEESQPFGRLFSLRWKVAHIFNQDVLLATSALCLYLHEIDKFETTEAAGQRTRSPLVEEIRHQLTIAHKIWLHMSAASPAAGKVAKALSIVLGKAATPSTEEVSRPEPSDDFLTDFDTMPLNDFGATFNNQYFHSGFYSPLAFFDNVLETQGT